jgi:hypothetical protein
MAEANDRRRTELAIYVWFTLPVSFFPILCLYLARAYDGHYSTPAELVTNGGVLTIAITLAAEALSRLIASGKRWRDLKMFAASCSAGVNIFGSIFYALRYVRSPANPTLFVDVCFSILLVGIATATFARFLPEDDP